MAKSYSVEVVVRLIEHDDTVGEPTVISSAGGYIPCLIHAVDEARKEFHETSDAVGDSLSIYLV